MTLILRRLARAAAMLAMAAPGAVLAQTELRFTCYGDGNECEVMRELLDRFEADNPDITVALDKVPYKAILESLPVQLAAGEGPDLARVTDLAGLHPYYLDLTPYVDAAYWEANFGETLDWYRAGPDDQGIYGMMTQLTITGPYINRTLFEQAINRQALRLSLDEKQSLDALDREAVMTLTADDIAEAALALGEEPEPEPTPEPEQPRWWRWLA